MRNALKLKLIKLSVAIISAYATLFVANFILYNYGCDLFYGNPAMQEHLLSNSIVRRENYPRYRRSFHGFLPPQSGTSSQVGSSLGDVYSSLGLKQPLYEANDIEPITWPAADCYGWLNTNDLTNASAIFIGDSFGRGNGAGHGGSIPTNFEKLTGLSSYVAANEGYGFQQYHEILNSLLDIIGGTSSNKTVYVLFCLENDFSIDYQHWIKLIEDDRVRATWLFRVWRYGMLRSLSTFVKSIEFRKSKPAALTQSGNLMSTNVLSKDYLSSVDGKTLSGMYGGWFPVYLNLSHYEDRPFAFFAGNHVQYKEIGWFNERKSGILDIFKSYARIAKERGLNIRFVMLPSTLQLSEPYICNSLPDSEFSLHRAEIVKNMGILKKEVIELATSQGLEVLDATDDLSQAIVTQKIIWPGDIHYTKTGYKVVASAIANKWHQKELSR